MIAVVETYDIEFVVFSRFFSFLDSYNPQPLLFSWDLLFDWLFAKYIFESLFSQNPRKVHQIGHGRLHVGKFDTIKFQISRRILETVSVGNIFPEIS